MKVNPFATKFVAPGQIPWIASDAAHSIANLSRRFSDLGHRAAIVGEHGSGKSTLLEHLVPALGSVRVRLAAYETTEVPRYEYQARDVVWLRLRGRMLSRVLVQNALKKVEPTAVLFVVDGYEQLSWWMRMRLLSTTARRKQGLLLTSHRKTRLPTLIQTQMTPELALEIIHQILPEDFASRATLLDPDKITGMLTQHHGNLREVLMQLYDEM